MLRVGVVGTSGYAGGELLRYLLSHPDVTLAWVASRSHVGERVSEAFPNLRGLTDLTFDPLDVSSMATACDCVFTAVPAGVGMEMVGPIVDGGARLIDLGPDFRLHDPETYERWYKTPHNCRSHLKDAIYGLPELHREQLSGARVVGNPGCYPTASVLALAPLAEAGLLDESDVSVYAMSGFSGAGSSPTSLSHLPEAAENARPYASGGHRHAPEIGQELSELAGHKISICFTPHLVPMSRGILVTCSVALARPLDADGLRDVYESRYGDEPFVEVLQDALPETKAVAGTNRCDVAVEVDRETGRAVVMAAIDNLGKGAAGQAIQNMNVLFGVEETRGLKVPGLLP